MSASVETVQCIEYGDGTDWCRRLTKLNSFLTPTLKLHVDSKPPNAAFAKETSCKRTLCREKVGITRVAVLSLEVAHPHHTKDVTNQRGSSLKDVRLSFHFLANLSQY